MTLRIVLLSFCLFFGISTTYAQKQVYNKSATDIAKKECKKLDKRLNLSEEQEEKVIELIRERVQNERKIKKGQYPKFRIVNIFRITRIFRVKVKSNTNPKQAALNRNQKKYERGLKKVLTKDQWEKYQDIS